MNDDDFQKIWDDLEEKYLKSKGWQELTYDITGVETWHLPFNKLHMGKNLKKRISSKIE